LRQTAKNIPRRPDGVAEVSGGGGSNGGGGGGSR